MVLHRGCNALLGKVENNYKRYGVSEKSLQGMVPLLYGYIYSDWSENPKHPSFGKVKRRVKRLIKKRKI